MLTGINASTPENDLYDASKSISVPSATAEELAKWEAELAERGGFPNNILYRAIVEKDLGKAQYAINNGADINLKLIMGHPDCGNYIQGMLNTGTPLRQAVEQGNISAVRLLFQTATEKKIVLIETGEAIRLASEKKNINLVRLLCALSGKRHETDLLDLSKPIIIPPATAVELNDWDKELLQYQRNANKLLFKAINDDSLSKMQYAIHNGACINFKPSAYDANGEYFASTIGHTPLTFAVQKNNIPAVRYLFQVAAERNIDIRKSAALRIATEKKNATLVRILLAYGISPKKHTHYDRPEKSPFQIAADKEDADTLGVLCAFEGLIFGYDRFKAQRRESNHNNSASSSYNAPNKGFGYH